MCVCEEFVVISINCEVFTSLVVTLTRFASSGREENTIDDVSLHRYVILQSRADLIQNPMK